MLMNSRTRIKVSTRASCSLIASYMLAACTTIDIVDEPDPALVALTSVANEVNRMTSQFAKLQHPEKTDNYSYDARLSSRISVVDYVGPPEVLLKQIAMRIGYRFVDPKYIEGEIAPRTLTIVVRANNQRVIDVIRNIGAQLGDNGVISLSKPKAEIVLEYR